MLVLWATIIAQINFTKDQKKRNAKKNKLINMDSNIQVDRQIRQQTNYQIQALEKQTYFQGSRELNLHSIKSKAKAN